MNRKPNYIFVIGESTKSLKRTRITAIIARMLKKRNYNVFLQKLVVDKNNIGETFVIEDGTETDFSIGVYERYLDESLSNNCYLKIKEYSEFLNYKYDESKDFIIIEIDSNVKLNLQKDYENSFIINSDDFYDIEYLYDEKIDQCILKHFNYEIEPITFYLPKYICYIKKVNIALVGKYTKIENSYVSIIEALETASHYLHYEIEIIQLDSNLLNDDNISQLKKYDGVIVPGGFGKEGCEGIISAIKYCRLNNIPFFGICFGMQLTCIEYARNVKGYVTANSTEIDSNTDTPIIHKISELNKNCLRLGLYECKIEKETKAYNAYKNDKIIERHRHSYEFNYKYDDIFDEDFIIASTNINTNSLEIVELKNHPWFLACQFHPEFVSRYNNPHPLFKGFLEAIIKNKEV